MNSSLFVRDLIARGMASNNKVIIDELTKLTEESNIIDYDNTSYTYDVDGNLTTIVWKDSLNATLRTDSFTYSSTVTTETIVQTIAITGGNTITITTVFDLEGNILSVDRVVS